MRSAHKLDEAEVFPDVLGRGVKARGGCLKYVPFLASVNGHCGMAAGLLGISNTHVVQVEIAHVSTNFMDNIH